MLYSYKQEGYQDLKTLLCKYYKGQIRIQFLICHMNISATSSMLVLILVVLLTELPSNIAIFKFRAVFISYHTLHLVTLISMELKWQESPLDPTQSKETICFSNAVILMTGQARPHVPFNDSQSWAFQFTLSQT